MAANEGLIETIRQNYVDAATTREDWEEAVKQFFDQKDEEQERYDDWTDDAYYFSADSIIGVGVKVTSYGVMGLPARITDFQLTPDEARSMFLGIRDRYTGN